MTAPDPAVAHALLAVAKLAHDEVDRAGLLDDDVVGCVIAACERWLKGKATVDEVRAERSPGAVARYAGDPVMGPLQVVVWYLTAYVAARDGGVVRSSPETVRLRAADCLTALGESPVAAKARVAVVYDAALREATERRPRQDGGG